MMKPERIEECKTVRQAACLFRARGGGALIEFAFVAPFVILIMMATIELSWAFFVSAALEGAAESAARKIRTGQVQRDADPVTVFQAKLCEQLFNLIDCAEVTFDVRGFSDFSSVEAPLLFDERGKLIGATFAPGNSGEITIVRVLYRWRFLTPLISNALAANNSNGALLLATMAFQNEPYELGG